VHIDDDDFNLSDLKRLLYDGTDDGIQSFGRFKTTGVHYAMVADEYGIFQGIITLNDILEALVGNVSDFIEKFELVKRDDGTWLVDGHYSLHDFRLTLTWTN
jgi:putative hemolysin